MQYMLLIYGNEKMDTTATPEDFQATLDAYNAFTAEVRQANALVAGEALHPTSSATSVRMKDGKFLTTDGPFAETHEQLGGFYIVECKDLDEAIEWAKKVPGVKYGTIEVRPIVDFSAPQA